MHIGLDVDGVLVDTRTFQLREGKKYFRKFGLCAKKPDMFEVQDVFECSKEQREKFWTKYIWRYCLREPITKDAPRVVKKLREEGHEVIIITSRVHTTETGITGKLFRWMLKHWLKKNHLEYDDIVFCKEKGSGVNKRQVCKDKNIDIMIDDTPENLYAVQEVCRVICYSAAWNRDYHNFDYCRANDFDDVYLKIQE